MTPEIGQWVRRLGLREAKWHRVETLVNDLPTVHCGREFRLEDAAGHELEVSPVEPLTRMIGQPQNCAYCSREAV